MKLYATTSWGLENALAGELELMGVKPTEIQRGGIEFEGDLETLYTAWMGLRTAIRLLRPLRDFSASTPEMLYDQVRRVPWEKWLTLDTTFAVEASIAKTSEPGIHSSITHSKYAALKIKDAIVDRMRKEVGARPNVDVADPMIPLRAHFKGTKCTLSLDACGESLHIRGYRQSGVEAPLQETLAAGLLLYSGWNPKTSLFDPMCGSGTILIEGALMASQVAPGLLRDIQPPFTRWPDFDAALFERVREKAKKARISPPKTPVMVGWDQSRSAIRAARENAERAGVQNWVRWEVRDAKVMEPPPELVPGTLLVNPPYGERIKVDGIEKLYEDMGSAFKKKFPGWKAGVLTGNEEARKHIGLKSSKKFPLKNGPLECKFYLYEMYEGSRKKSPTSEN